MKLLLTSFCCITLISCSFNSNSNAQSTSDPEMIIDDFFKIYASKGPKTALQFILSTNKWSSEGKAELQASLQSIVSQLGRYYGYEFITKTTVSKNYVLWSYMISYERQPIRFNFIFYRPDKTWQLQDFRYDNDLDVELIEAARIYRLPETSTESHSLH